MLAYINQCSRLLTVFFDELRLLKQMLPSCNQVSHSHTGTLAVCFNELWQLPGMFASFSQISHSLTGTSILLLCSFFKKLKRHRTNNFHNDVIAFDTFIRITEIGSNLGVNLIPQFRVPFGMFISVPLVEEKLRMTASLKRIFQSREELVRMNLDVFSKCCFPPVQSRDLVLNSLGTKVSSCNSVEDKQKENLVRLHYREGILHRKNISTLSIV